jgi:hypothetical protein
VVDAVGPPAPLWEQGRLTPAPSIRQRLPGWDLWTGCGQGALQRAIEAGANLAALVDALNKAQQERQAARTDLNRIPVLPALSHADTAALIDDLGDVGQALNRADPAGLKDLYAALRLEMVYNADTKTVDVTIRPAGRGSARVRGELAH